MTKKQYIAAIVDDQIKRGIIPANSREFQIKCRLKGIGMLRPMSLTDCKKAYDGYFAE